MYSLGREDQSPIKLQLSLSTSLDPTEGQWEEDSGLKPQSKSRSRSNLKAKADQAQTSKQGVEQIKLDLQPPKSSELKISPNPRVDQGQR